MPRLLLLLTFACATPEPSLLPVDEAAPPIFLTTDAFVLGHGAEIRVSGVRPGGSVYIGYSVAGPGQGPCPPTLPTGCLGIVAPQLIATLTADGSGEARMPLNLPAVMPFAQVWMQAATLGPNGAASNIVSNVFLQPNADEDGDGLSNGEEADLGSNPFRTDTDSGGAGDSVEVSVGTDPANRDDDILHEVDGVAIDLTIDLDFRGSLASAACLFAGYCDCQVTYRGVGSRSDAWDLTLEFDGTWTQVSNDCATDLDFDAFIWTPASGNAFHTAEFSPGAQELVAWGVSANAGPLMAVPDPIAARQAYVNGLSVPWNRPSPIVFAVQENTQPSGVDLRTTITGTVALTGP